MCPGIGAALLSGMGKLRYLIGPTASRAARELLHV